MAERPTRIFISYAHADHAHLEAFRQHFGPVEHGQNLEVWFDGELAGGQVWNDRIHRAINASDIFVCLVTSAFLNSNYIRDAELPAIWQAVRGRSALLLPVIVERSFWQQEFGQVQCLPSTPKGALRPAADWKPKRNGLHAAAEQAAHAIEVWLRELPPPPADPGLGAGLIVTPDGFDLVPDVPGPAERADPLQLQLLAGLRGRWRTLIDDAHSCRNTHPVLHRELVAYGEWIKAELAELDVMSLVTAGSALGGLVEALKPPLPPGVMTEPLEPALLAGFETLLREHARLVFGFAEGREILARDQLLHSRVDGPAALRQTLHRVLRPMAKARGLLTARASDLMRMLDDAMMEAGVRSADLLGSAVRHGGRAIGSIVQAVGRKVQPANALTYAGFAAVLAGDPNFETYRAAFQFLSANTAQLSAFAANVPELRRLVDWTAEQLGARARPAPARNEGSHPIPEVSRDDPPEGFDLDEVHAMIRRGETPPNAWVPWIRELEFRETSINNLSPIAGLVDLESLDCSGTWVYDLSPLSNLKKLRRLYVARIPEMIIDPTPILRLKLDELVLLKTDVRPDLTQQLAKYQINSDGIIIDLDGAATPTFYYYAELANKIRSSQVTSF